MIRSNHPLKMAKGLWTLLLQSSKFQNVQLFLSFLEEETPVKVINRDQWEQFYEFSLVVPEDLTAYDQSGAYLSVHLVRAPEHLVVPITTGRQTTAMDIIAEQDVVNQDEFDLRMGFARLSNATRLGWMINMTTTSLKDSSQSLKAAVDFYFVEEDGGTFKVTIPYSPYFYVICRPGTEPDVEQVLLQKFSKTILTIEKVEKEDLSLPNHLAGTKRTLLKLSFNNVQDLLSVRKYVLSTVRRASRGTFGKPASNDAYQSFDGVTIDDVREYDVIYYIRAAIDCDFRVGLWYEVREQLGKVEMTVRRDRIKRAEPIVLAYDIETTKLPLKFPDSSFDNIMMISYMVDGQGYLITNRDIVSQDISDFEYTPKPEFEGPFHIFNEANELAVIQRFFTHIREIKPNVIVTYNGDFFDMPFVEARANHYGLDMKAEIGIAKDANGEYRARHAVHVDAFCWVKRDSYLPQGSQGLKAVTKYKLGYNPIEVDPEDMTRFAAEQPQTLAQYSVSDAVATYYLYMKYVHPFIFSLCNIIPMNPDDILRRGSGTLCETLLMVEAYKANVIMPNKHEENTGKKYNGHLLETETYVGGHVEALEAGVFRSDLPMKFRLVPEALTELIDEIDHALKFSIEVEGNLRIDDIANYDEVREAIVSKLETLRDMPIREEPPLIYHLDVAAMYPNIILTNRLQPDAMVEEEECVACDFYEGKESKCQRRMQWSWRGEFFPAEQSELNMIRIQLERELFPGPNPSDPQRSFRDLKFSEQNAIFKKRVEEYSRKVYSKKHVTEVVTKESIICQRENPFYVDTVRSFRDRRYEYKGLLKTWKKKLDDAAKAGNVPAVDEAKKLTVVYDSLQLAHKCILNSFYGYVMRKGARWYSMEMAGIVCLTGAKIIQLARKRVEKLGRPLELDTDGIWCTLPKTFPESFNFKLKNGKQFNISYPCVMLNHLVHAEFTNHQYQDLSPDGSYQIKSENSIFFEVDGPYRAMILPSSTEEDKLLKKRYAVFNHDGSLAELKGFEIKRRGELKLIKIFQSEIFQVFLDGGTLQECYSSVAKVADQWLDVLYSRGSDLDDVELFDLISENRSMSRSLDDYGAQKSTSISTAKRLAEFLGDQMVKDKGLNCKFVISLRPFGLPVSERAIPVSIFFAEENISRYFLRKWLKDPSLTTINIRDILDWQYYLDRFGSVIQKLITIPAAMQDIPNPIERVKHPDWLLKRLAQVNDSQRQQKITSMFRPLGPGVVAIPEKTLTATVDEGMADKENIEANTRSNMDIEDLMQRGRQARSTGVKPLVNRINIVANEDEDENDPLVPAASIDSEYSAWLVSQKKRWAQKKLKKARSSTSFGPRGSIASWANTLVPGQTVHILQIVETEVAGEFLIWFLLNGALQSAKLEAKRTFFINCRKPFVPSIPLGSDITVEKTNKVLPRSQVSYHLYEVTMSEAVFRDQADDLAKMFTHHDIEGVYETKMPLLFKVLISVGSVACYVGKDRQGFKGRMALRDLRPEPAKKIRELSFPVRFIYLFQGGKGSRQIFGVYLPAAEQAFIHFVDPSLNNSAIPNLGRLYAEKLERYSGVDSSLNGGASFDYPSNLKVDHSLHRDLQSAIKAIVEQLRGYRRAKPGPTMLALQASLTNFELSSAGFVTLSELPFMRVPAHPQDSNFPAVGWQQQSSRRLFSHLFNVKEWLVERLGISEYGSIPLGNIESDYPIFLADVFYARRLVRNDFVLWYNDDRKPDLGGREQDENRDSTSTVSPEQTTSGSFSNICIEMDVYNMAFNTILQWTLLSDLEDDVSKIYINPPDFHKTKPETSTQSSQSINEKGALVHFTHGVNESAPNLKSLKIMREMVQLWHVQFESQQNRSAEMMLEHFDRWLTDPSSRLYDPVIYDLVHRLMCKIYNNLVESFQSLGSTIVFAGFEKIIICSCKPSIDKAMTYAQFAIESVRKQPLFSYIDVQITHFWCHLLWLDKYNYGGVLYCDDSDAMEDGMKVEADYAIDMKWSLVEMLPHALHEDFRSIIGEFLCDLNQRKDSKEDLSSIELVSKGIRRKLFSLIPTISQKYHNVDDASSQVSEVGMHSRKNAALNFIKVICAVLELKVLAAREMRGLRRDLLNVIGMREFSEATKFENPFQSFVLARTVCSYCSLVHDLDLSKSNERTGSEVDGKIFLGGLVPNVEPSIAKIILNQSCWIASRVCSFNGKFKIFHVENAGWRDLMS
ncbi:DNA polymerase epsilon catalytic subunit [Dinochytrium kinnereticum]|nr:DNA polymerase epsilon catalytic subunit [Dinochytrium kinnereticum]